jgi:hypothetical protein
MTFTTMLILNVVLDIVIISALAFVMSRPAKLTPHAEPMTARTARRRAERLRFRPREEHSGAPLRPVVE